MCVKCWRRLEAANLPATGTGKNKLKNTCFFFRMMIEDVANKKHFLPVLTADDTLTIQEE
jgi:hypothetical protein